MSVQTLVGKHMLSGNPCRVRFRCSLVMRRGWHLHSVLGRCVCLGDGLGDACEDFLLLLDHCAAGAPVRYTAIAKPASLDVVLLSNLSALHHAVDPSAPGNAVNTSHNQTVIVECVVGLHARVSHALRRPSNQYARQEASKQAVLASSTAE